MTRYRNIADREVLEHQPGEEFEADISEIQEQRLVAGGHIERVVELGPQPNDMPDYPGETEDKE